MPAETLQQLLESFLAKKSALDTVDSDLAGAKR
jgi:hypothetical protein